MTDGRKADVIVFIIIMISPTFYKTHIMGG